MEKQVQHLEFIKKCSRAIMENYNKAEVSRVAHAYLELNARIWAGASGLEQLVSGIKENPEFEFTIALNLRTMILDFFISLRGYDIRRRGEIAGKDEKQVQLELETYINSILGSGLGLTANHFCRMEKHGHINEEKLHEVLNNLTIRYSEFLEPYENDKKVKPKYPGAPNNGELFDKISENPELTQLAQEFDTYALYSKYEHFSIMSFDAFRRDKEAQAETVLRKIEILLLHAFKVVSMLLYFLKDKFIEEKFWEIGSYIGKNVFNLSDEEIVTMIKSS